MCSDAHTITLSSNTIELILKAMASGYLATYFDKAYVEYICQTSTSAAVVHVRTGPNVQTS